MIIHNRKTVLHLCTTNLISLLPVPKQFITHCFWDKSSSAWPHSPSQFWISLRAGSLTSGNDMAESLLRLRTLPLYHNIPFCYVPQMSAAGSFDFSLCHLPPCQLVQLTVFYFILFMFVKLFTCVTFHEFPKISSTFVVPPTAFHCLCSWYSSLPVHPFSEQFCSES